MEREAFSDSSMLRTLRWRPLSKNVHGVEMGAEKHGVESVRIIVATDAVLYSLSPLRVLFVHDGLHRCGRNNVDNMPVVSPICFTRYPTHPKGWIERPENFARPQGTFEERLRRGFQIRLDV